jgi:sRNA-binding carbon storage regulator CsrA
MGFLVLTRSPGKRIFIGSNLVIENGKKTSVKFSIECNDNITVLREEFVNGPKGYIDDLKKMGTVNDISKVKITINDANKSKVNY